MAEGQPPPNWVTERAKCNLELTWEALIQIVVRDVGEANALPASVRGDYAFDVEANEEGTSPMIRVGRKNRASGEYEGSATFIRHPGAIIVSSPAFEQTRGPEVLSITAIPVWDEKSLSCRLKVNGQRLKLWELSQEALGPLFFPV